MRPTGKLHLGNYMGALYNWVRLQHEYESYFFIADLHALTSDYADTSQIKQSTLDAAVDFLAAGLDPENCTLFVQSQVKAHFELPQLLAMITPLGWLERVPTYKEQQENLTNKDLSTYGFLGYPLMRRRTSCSTRLISCRWGRTRSRMWNSRARLRGGLTVLSFPTDATCVTKSPTASSRGSSRAAGAADAVAEAAGHGWPQDVEELWQYHPALRSGT